ncbi:MAG: (2Fe-2S) ferredoxin domain-containing protein [Candidatus Fimivicinus sp.]|nr:(2Fe-2S) ferredoxin domain-containing protein [Oscillospiraceae bacterium]MDY5590923.1 (2Fe-2S) ferredoxin domain-containing protein [Candidatus Fimivicinus sp.]
MEITICIGSSCHLHGSRDVIQVLEKLVSAHGLSEKVELKGSFCMGECTKGGVCVSVDGQKFSMTPAEVPAFFKNEVLDKMV